MKHLEWDFITENQKSKEKAEQLGQLLVKAIDLNTSTFAISKYWKFEDSYSIKLTTHFDQISKERDFILLLLTLTSSICRPWTVDFKQPVELVELFFNKQNNTKYSTPSFNVIKWGHVQLV